MDINDKIERVVVRFNSGDETAFTEFYELTFKNAIFHAKYVARQFDFPDSEVEDVLQECYIKAYQSLSSLKEPKTASKWLSVMITHAVSNAARANNNYRKKLVDDGEEVMPFIEDNDTLTPQEILEKEETSKFVTKMLNELTPERKLLVLLHYHDGLSVTEISKLLEIPVGTIKHRLQSIKAELKKKVDAEEKRTGTKLYSFSPLGIYYAFEYLIKGEKVSRRFALRLTKGIAASVGPGAIPNVAATATTISSASTAAAGAGILGMSVTKIVSAVAGVVLVGSITVSVVAARATDNTPVMTEPPIIETLAPTPTATAEPSPTPSPTPTPLPTAEPTNEKTPPVCEKCGGDVKVLEQSEAKDCVELTQTGHSLKLECLSCSHVFTITQEYEDKYAECEFDYAGPVYASVAPTCTEKGQYIYKCTHTDTYDYYYKDGEWYFDYPIECKGLSYIEIPETPHQYVAYTGEHSNYITNVCSVCENMYYTCKACGGPIETITSTSSNDYATYVQYEYICSNCGNWISQGGTCYEYYHEYQFSHYKIEPTCEEDGIAWYKCWHLTGPEENSGVCQAFEEVPVPALGHDWVSNTAEDGTEVITCSRCGITYTD